MEEDDIHDFDPYDYEVDTSTGVSAMTVAAVLAAWNARGTRRALLHGPG